MSESLGAVKAVFEENCDHLRFDIKLAKRIADFCVWFVNKNEEHIAFFGGNLTGVHVVRFTNQDKDKWFTDVLGIDDLVIEEQLHALPVIKTDWKVSSDVFNNTCVWLIHSFKNSPLINDSVKEEVMVNIALVLYFKFTTSLITHYFRYPADEQIAAATYASLSYKFALKQQGTWYKTLEARCIDMVDEKGLHAKTLKDFRIDEDIRNMLNDSQGRIRNMIKNIYGEFIRLHQMGARIRTTSAIIEHDGEQILRDSTKSMQIYTRYLHSIVGDKNSFIRSELVDLIQRVAHTMPPKLFKQTLEWCSANHAHIGSRDVENLIDFTMNHAFAFLSNNKAILRETSDLSTIVAKLRGIYMASRSSDIDLMAMRDLAQKIIRSATTTRNETVIASVRTGLLLYIVVRGFTMKHYTNQ